MNYYTNSNDKRFIALDHDFARDFFANKEIIHEIVDIFHLPHQTKKQIFEHQLAYIYDKSHTIDTHHVGNNCYIEDVSQLGKGQSHDKLFKIYTTKNSYLVKKLKNKVQMGINSQLEHTAKQEFEGMQILTEHLFPAIQPVFCYSSYDNVSEYIAYPLIKPFEILEDRFRFRDHEIGEKLYQEIEQKIKPLKDRLESQGKYLADVNARNIRVERDETQQKYTYQLFDILLLDEKPQTFYYGEG